MHLVVFDCDGTLIDSQNTIFHGLTVGFEAAGLAPPDRRTALSIVGLSLETAFAALLHEDNHHQVPLMADAYRQSKIDRRAKGLDHDPLYPGAREALDRLTERDDVLIGVATGKALRGVHHMMDVHELHNLFVTIQTADKAPSKPHPGMLIQAMAETGIDAERTVMIGDTRFDMEMANSAGVAGLGVSWGYHEKQDLYEAGAETVIDEFDQLNGVLVSKFNWFEG
ncbi:MAG: HAD-IA family hydrolase [Stappiaceae bacterium]